MDQHESRQLSRILEFRSNPLRQTALLKLLSEDENLQTALSICEHEKDLPSIGLDAPEIVSIRAAALARGATRVLDTLYMLSTPVTPPPPETEKEGTYGVDLSKLPPETEIL